MLNLVTGTPGAGKTQYVIDYVLNNDQFKGREVYYWGIPELADSLGWHRVGDDTFDEEAARRWHEIVPEGAIFIVDEAHKVWPKQKVGASEGAWYAPLGTTRHRGLTIFAITQYPAHVDTSYRGRVERHFHLERKLGMQRAFLLEFEKASNPANQTDRALATKKSYYKFKPEVWALYKSATIHNVERRPLPKKLLLVPIGLVVIIAGIWWVYSTLTGREIEARVDGEVIEGDAMVGVEGATPRLVKYVEERTPVFEGQSWTAPLYDDVRKVVAYPRPQCVEGEIDGVYRCVCYTQQASKMNVDEELCRGIVKFGYFDPSIPDQYLTAEEKPAPVPVAPQPQGPTFNIPYHYRADQGPRIDLRAAEHRIERMREL